jgi:Tfp pilus assembly protein PilN
MKTAINLLPAAYQRRLLVRRRAVQWGVVIGAVLVGGGVLRWNDERALDAAVQRLELLAREHQPTKRMLQELVVMRGQLDELQHYEQIAQELEQQRPVLSLLGILSAIAERTNGRLRITKLTLTGLQQPASAGHPSGPEARGGSAILTGLSQDNPAVAELIKGLEDSQFFSYVELLKLTDVEGEGGSLREYQIQCEL